MAGSGGMPYLNSHIVLISKSEIRYEGTLYTIDTTNSTVALQNVRSFGTEDRKKDNHIPPSPEVFDYIIFRGTDIKDLHVCDTPTPAAPPQPPAPAEPAQPPSAAAVTPQPPAASAPSAHALTLANPPAPPAAWGANPSQARSAIAPPASEPPLVAHAPSAALNSRPPAAGRRSQPGTGAHMSQRNTRDVGDGPKSTSDPGEFDFQKMLDAFDKTRLEQEASSKVKPTANTYNKTSSFFDTLDEEVTEEGGRRGRSFMAEMRKVDAETFGEELIRERRSGGRSRGRGGRGRGNGGGKGGEHRPQPSNQACDNETFGAPFSGAPLGARGGGVRGGGGRDSGRGYRGRGGGGGRGEGRGREGGRGGRGRGRAGGTSQPLSMPVATVG